eukprot:18874-Chlamydomonas_euryale.AAC.2
MRAPWLHHRRARPPALGCLNAVDTQAVGHIAPSSRGTHDVWPSLRPFGLSRRSGGVAATCPEQPSILVA